MSPFLPKLSPLIDVVFRRLFESSQLGLPEIAQAEEQLRVISQDQELRALYEARMKAQRDALAWEKDHIAEWIDEGKRLGIDEGKRLGEHAALRRAVLRLLEVRGIPVSDAVRAQIDGCHDSSLLDIYLTRAAAAASADELLSDR